ncbi:MAG: dihydroneopterin aldolase, partial [Chloroflexota bacterium]
RHGAFAEEREAPQEFAVDLECPVAARVGARSDDLGGTLDYRALAEAAREVIEGPPRRLIETLVQEIASRVLERAPADWVRVRVSKLHPPSMPGVASVSVVRRSPGRAGPDGRSAPTEAHDPADPRAPDFAAVELHVPDFAPVREFYGRLGFVAVRDEPDRGAGGYLVMRRGRSVLRFWPGSDRLHEHPYFGSFPAGSRRGYGVEIVVVVDDLEALYEEARTFAAVLEPLRPRPWGLRDFRLADPFGYYLRITEPHDAARPTTEGGERRE